MERYEMISVTRCGEGWQELQKEEYGDWVLYEDVEAELATLRSENERLKAQLAALENPAATHDWMQHGYGFKCRKCQCIDGSTAAAYPCEGTQATQKGSE